MLHRINRHLNPTGEVELLQNVLYVDLDRAFSYIKMARDFLVGFAARQALDDLAFAGGELVAFGRGGRITSGL